MTERIIIAQFFKRPGGGMLLHGMTVIEEKISPHYGVQIARDYYDVEWSNGCGCYLFDHSGSGGGNRPSHVTGLYFISGPARVIEKKSLWCYGGQRPDPAGLRTRAIRKRNRTRRLFNLPKHFDLQPGDDLFDWLQNENIEQDAVWCSECVDYVRGDYLCEHTWWCDKIGWYSTPSERCGHDPKECAG